MAGQRTRSRVLDRVEEAGIRADRRRLARIVLGAVALAASRGGQADRADSLRLYLPFPLIGAPEYIGALPASRAQRGFQAASPAGPTDTLARLLARVAEGLTGQSVRVVRLPGGRGERACEAVAADPRGALFASEALCVHDAVAAASLRLAVDRLEICLPVARIPYRRVASRPGPVGSPCTIAHAGHGGRGAHLAARLAASGVDCRDVAFNGGEAALRAVLGGQAGQAVLPWSVARAAVTHGSLRDLGAVEPAGWFVLLSRAGSRWSGLAAELGSALRERAPEPVFDRLGLLPAGGSAEALRATMLRERQELVLSSLRAAPETAGGMG